jgi:hypothetical protein
LRSSSDPGTVITPHRTEKITTEILKLREQFLNTNVEMLPEVLFLVRGEVSHVLLKPGIQQMFCSAG